MSDNKRPDPRCGRCGKLAADMAYLDTFWAEDASVSQRMEEDERWRERAEYIRHSDGTYNSATERFWCDPCYVAIGTPAGRCP